MQITERALTQYRIQLDLRLLLQTDHHLPIKCIINTQWKRKLTTSVRIQDSFSFSRCLIFSSKFTCTYYPTFIKIINHNFVGKATIRKQHKYIYPENIQTLKKTTKSLIRTARKPMWRQIENLPLSDPEQLFPPATD